MENKQKCGAVCTEEDCECCNYECCGGVCPSCHTNQNIKFKAESAWNQFKWTISQRFMRVK